MVKLGVNIDHIATLREARKESFPDPLSAAKEALSGGADGIVCHLREDRRHIQERDILGLKKMKVRLDLEMAPTAAMLAFALKIKPEMVTLVPEKRLEITTEGGLDLLASRTKLAKMVQRLKKAGIVVSLFIDPDIGQIKAAAELGADFIELHTGCFARASYVKGKSGTTQKELAKLKRAAQLTLSLGLRVNAGHGLDYHNAAAIAKIKGVEELNIGFSIIARGLSVGIRTATAEMRRIIK
ncbi:MAG: pyridoxine 5'-phosphate synthase [Candidatus Margulisbacteria bacterium]|nr:pyridoxine 5'-phosphate synthase [Candidatus Margulisiibacteriota bacterium]